MKIRLVNIELSVLKNRFSGWQHNQEQFYDLGLGIPGPPMIMCPTLPTPKKVSQPQSQKLKVAVLFFSTSERRNAKNNNQNN